MPHAHTHRCPTLTLLILLLTLATNHTQHSSAQTPNSDTSANTSTTPPPAFSLRELPPLPDAEGFAGAFAGISENHLLAIGGANFPEKKPWEGGTKVWSDRVYALPLSIPRSIRQGQTPAHPALLMNRTPWKLAGRWPNPTGYGVSVTHHNEVLCIGGSNSTQHHSAVIAVRYLNSTLTLRQLPALPNPLANHCGTRVGNLLFISGGQTTPNSAPAESATWTLDLTQPEQGWNRLPDCPGPPRILATAASTGTDFWVVGGASLQRGPDGKPVRTWLKDAWRWSPANGWQQLPDLPAPRVAAPSPAPTLQQSPILLGGDDGSQATSDPRTHRGFNITTLSLSLNPPHQSAWTTTTPFPPAVVTTPTVAVDDFWIIPSGEIRPGIRSPATWLLHPTQP
jgi:N-acetylneuraminic acid mutarotase